MIAEFRFWSEAMITDPKSKIQNLKFWLSLLLLLGALVPAPAQAAHKVPNGPPPFAYPVAPPTPLLVAQDDAPPVVQAVTTPAPMPTPTPAADELTFDRFILGFVLIVVGTLGVGLAVLGLRRARRLRDATLPDKAPPARRP
jgi:hypothetical protein